MDYDTYKKIIEKDNKVEWYGVEIPEGLITKKVKYSAGLLQEEINKLKSELDDRKGISKDKLKKYIEKLETNIKQYPYTLNGDTYQKKRKKIEEELSKKTTKRKRKTSNKKKK